MDLFTSYTLCALVKAATHKTGKCIENVVNDNQNSRFASLH